MNKRQLMQVTAFLSCFVIEPSTQAHPGSLDLNGGHYFGPSYHCHMTAAQSRTPSIQCAEEEMAS